MHNSSDPKQLLAPLLARLVGSGVPISEALRLVEELEEHWDDLRQEALANDLSDDAAAAYASKALGSHDELFSSMRATMRRTSIVGRWPTIAFIFSPLVALGAWWLIALYAFAWISGLLAWADDHSLPAPNWSLLQQLVDWNQPIAMFALATLFCHLALRSYRGFGWAFAACLLLAIHNAFHFIRFTAPPAIGGKGDFMWGYTFKLNALYLHFPAFAPPLLIFASFLLIKTLQEKRLKHSYE